MVVNASLALLYPTMLTALTQSGYTVFPNHEGIPHLIKLDSNPLTSQEFAILDNNVNAIAFLLYTRNNPKNEHILKLNDPNSVKGSNWDEKKETILAIHGWGNGDNNPMTVAVRDAFLQVMDVNVIVVNWGSVSSNIIYPFVVKSIPAVANRIADFVNFLRSNAGLQTSKLKVVGHSLGAHVAGLSARAVSKSSTVAEVVALDPAKPMFDNKGPGERVDRTDASNVQVVHTSTLLVGLDTPVGTSDFFANGGKLQPGCVNDFLGACAHGRSYLYYCESIKNPKGFPGASRNGNGKAYMGGPHPDPNAKGSYDFKTNAQPPYALGG